MNNLHAPLEKIEIIPCILEQFELEPLLFIQNKKNTRHDVYLAKLLRNFICDMNCLQTWKWY